MSGRQPIAPEELERIRSEFPFLPQSYFNYLREVGWGMSDSGYMIYNAPIHPGELYPDADLDHRVMIGDDGDLNGLAYDFESREFGEFTKHGDWEYFEQDFDLHAFLTGKC